MIILSQCFGQISSLAFDNGLMFNYFDHLDSDDSTILLLMKMPGLVRVMMILPLAYLSDKYGKKKLGQWGMAYRLSALAVYFLLLGLAVWKYGLFKSEFLSLHLVWLFSTVPGLLDSKKISREIY